MKERFVFYEFRLHQVTEIHDGTHRVTVTEGYATTNVPASSVIELTLDTLKVSRTFELVYVRLLEFRNLNFSEIKPLFVDLWLQACRSTSQDEIDSLTLEAEKLSEEILDRVIQFQVRGIRLFRP